MKRRVIQRVVVFLLLLLAGGAIVNVAVAWGFASRIQIQKRITIAASTVWYGNGASHSASVGTSCGFGIIIYERGTNMSLETFQSHQSSLQEIMSNYDEELVLPLASIAGRVRHQQSSVNDFVVIDMYAGWPCKSWSCALNYSSPVTLNSWVGRATVKRGLLVNNRSPGPPIVLPYNPIWPGFAINTIFYAAILWVVFYAPGAVRRTIRRRRGLCPACAYPVGTSAVCTKCGNAIASN